MTTGNQAQLDRNTDSEVEVDCASCDCYYSPELEEFIVIEDAVAASEFDNEVSLIAHRMNEYAQAKHDYGVMLEEYEKEKQKSTAEQRVKKIEIAIDHLEELMESAIDHLEERMESARKRLHEAIQVKDEQGVDDYVSYQDMIELIPLARRSKQKEKENKHKDLLGRKFVYASRKKYQLDTENPQKGFKEIKPKYTDQLKARESIYTKNKKGEYTQIDTAKLQAQLKNIEPQLKLYNVNVEHVTPALVEWGDSWNNLDGNISVSAEAQALRFAMNMGASTSLTRNGMVSAVHYAASLNLVEGKAQADYFYPDKIGWKLKMAIVEPQPGIPDSGEAIDLGHMRVQLKLDLAGSVGASILLNASLEVGYIDDDTPGDDGEKKQNMAVRGHTPAKKGRAFSQRQNKGADTPANRNQPQAHLQRSVAGFVGAQLGGGLTGGLQWLQPLENDASQLGSPTARYKEFCTLAVGVSALAGAGVGGTFNVGFSKGHLLVEMDASFCVGLGARGRAGFMVAGQHIAEFLGWFAYQLYRVDFTKVDFINNDDFIAIAKLMALRIVHGPIVIGIEAWDTAEFLFNEVSSFYNGVLKSMAESQGRWVLSGRINTEPENYLQLLPEARAILLWMLTESSIFDIRHETCFFDRYCERKQAILNVLQGIQTVRDWDNVMCRINPEARFVGEGNKTDAIRQGEERIRKFLTHGINRDQNMQHIKDNFLGFKYQNFFGEATEDEYMLVAVDAIKARLKSRPAVGYPMVMNYTAAYHLYTDDNPDCLAMCSFGGVV